MAVKLITLFLIMCVLDKCNPQMSREMAYATVPQLISKAGYPVEKHRVSTDDGYSLQLHRIPAGRRVAKHAQFSSKGKRAVLVVHGLLGSSGDFVIMGPERSLAYFLADGGYDVWLANLRGTIYSSHQNYTRNNPKFWEYSFHEHGKYDIPASIDRILDVTGLSKVMYIGYSMGTTTFFTMMSERPEYNEKVISFVALAPAVYLHNMKPLSELLVNNWNLVQRVKAQGMISLTFPRDLLDTIINNVCYVKPPYDDVCMRFIYTVVGEDREQYDWDMTSIMLSRIQPASWRQLEHYAKIAITDVFTSWEDGLFGAVKPYNLSNVRVPVSLLYGKNDHLTEKSQIMRLARQLNESGVLEVARPACSWPKFNHLDFAFAKDVGTLFNKPLVHYVHEMFDKYAPT